MVTGEIVTEIPVTGSVHEEEDAAVEVVAAVVVQVTAVLGAAEWHEASPNIARVIMNRERRFTAPRYSIAENSIPRVRALPGARRKGMLDSCASISTHLSEIQN
jgi:hypothetical protein